MNEQMSDFELQLHQAVKTYLGGARLELAPAAVVADVVARPVERPTVMRRNFLLALGGVAALVLAAVLLPVWRPIVAPQASSTPAPSASPSAHPSAPPSQTSAPTGSPTTAVNPVIPAPQLIPDKDLLAGGTTVHFTNIRRFALNLPPVTVSALGPRLRAIDDTRLVVSLYDGGGSSSTWLMDLERLQMTRLSDLQLVDMTREGDRLLMAGDIDGQQRFVIIDALTGDVQAQIAVHGTSHAAFLADGTVALATGGHSLGIWDGASYSPMETVRKDFGAFNLAAVGNNVIATHGGVHEFLDPATGLQLIPPWQGPLPLPSLDGDSFVAFVAGDANVFFGTHFDLELRDGSTGLTQLKGAGNDDASATGAGIGSDVWLSPSVLVARFRTAVQGPSGFPSGWSTERDFVLASSLLPLGNGTDDYFPANSRLVENHGVLMVLDGSDIIVMTVTETNN